MMSPTWSTLRLTAELWIQRCTVNLRRRAITTPTVRSSATPTPNTSDRSDSTVALVPRNPRPFIRAPLPTSRAATVRGVTRRSPQYRPAVPENHLKMCLPTPLECAQATRPPPQSQDAAWRARLARPAADATQDHRLELRSAGPTGATVVPPAGHRGVDGR